MMIGTPAMAGGSKMNQLQNMFSSEALAEIWNISGDLALEFADAMPAEYYDYRPVDNDELYTYAGQMLHIAQNSNGLMGSYITGKEPPKIPESAEGQSKDSIMAALRDAFDFGRQVIAEQTPESLIEEVEFFAGPLPRWHVIFIAQDHTAHHIGQSVIYLRAKGITPPSYRKW